MSNVEVVIEGVGKVRLPDGCQWVARDHDGSWWAYKRQPEANVTEGCWDVPGVDVAHLLTAGGTVVPDWLETLRRVGADEVCPECRGKGWTPEAGVDFGGSVICPDCAGSGRVEDSITANEAKPPSAPVGMEDAIRQELRSALAWGATYGKTIPGHQWDEMRDRMVEQHLPKITATLAQQPAAVDEAMERVRRGPAQLWKADLVGGKISVERMREILTAALGDQS